MPHCSLTGFFHDDRESAATYIEALDAALRRARPTQPHSVLAITEMMLDPLYVGVNNSAAYGWQTIRM
jgi:hypothetical protein